MNNLSKSFKKIQSDDEMSFSADDLQIFEDAAYVMARHANPDINERTADEWLDSFDMFSIYEILPELLILWGENNRTTSRAKKK